MRLNEIRDLTAKLLTDVCNDVQIEPDLQEITTETMTKHTANTAEGARLDIAANGFWGGRRERMFIDVRVFNSFAPSNRQMSLDKCFLKHEKEKKRACEQCVREVEHASFVPLVVSATCRRYRQGSYELLQKTSITPSEKWDQTYNETMHWLRCLISFCLLRSAIQCIREPDLHVVNLSPVDLVTAEANLQQG